MAPNRNSYTILLEDSKADVGLDLRRKFDDKKYTVNLNKKNFKIE